MMPSGRTLQLGLLLVVLAEYRHWHHIQHSLLVVGNQPAKTNKLDKNKAGFNESADGRASQT
jgi:hypothetical protein